jgi:hypothetical protein
MFFRLKPLLVGFAVKFVVTTVVPRMTFVWMEFESYHEEDWELWEGLGRGVSCQIRA